MKLKNTVLKLYENKCCPLPDNISLQKQNTSNIFEGVISCFTAMKKNDESFKISDDIIIRASPNFNNRPWYDWVNVVFSDDPTNCYPAQIYTFINWKETVKLNNWTSFVKQYNKSSLCREKSLALIKYGECAEIRKVGITSCLGERFILENDLSIIPTSALNDQIYVCELGTFEGNNYVLRLHNKQTMAKLFFNSN